MALPRLPMHEYLLKKEYVKSEQLDEAKKVQDQTKDTDLGRVLVNLGMVGEREVSGDADVDALHLFDGAVVDEAEFVGLDGFGAREDRPVGVGGPAGFS